MTDNFPQTPASLHKPFAHARFKPRTLGVFDAGVGAERRLLRTPRKVNAGLGGKRADVLRVKAQLACVAPEQRGLRQTAGRVLRSDVRHRDRTPHQPLQ